MNVCSNCGARVYPAIGIWRVGRQFAGIDRAFLARELGFERSARIAGKRGDRDHLLEFLAWAAFLQTHLSRSLRT